MTYFKNVVKRNGITVPFDEKKIENAIAKAFIATGEVEARNVSTIAGAITLMHQPAGKLPGNSYRRGYPGPRGIHADEMRLREDRKSLHLIP